MVLAGGQSRRFGSDKALARLRGKTLLEHVLGGLLRERFEQILVAWKPGDAERNKAYANVFNRASGEHLRQEIEEHGVEEVMRHTGDAKRRYFVKGVQDASPVQTPLAGLAAGLAGSRHELVFVCAADMPFAPDQKLVDALFAAIEGSDAVLPELAEVQQPLCALWRRTPALAAARQLLSLSEPAGPRALSQRLVTAVLPWPDPRPFLDADTPDALSAL